MQQYSDKVLRAINKDSTTRRRIEAGLMVAFDVDQRSIKNMLKENEDIRLTAREAINIVSEHTGLSEEEMFYLQTDKA